MARRRTPYEEFLALPEHLVGEILDGELYTSPRPASPHAFACGGAFGAINGTYGGGGEGGGPGGWWILFEPELRFGPQILVPDMAGWRRERMPKLPNVAYFELAPDWVCEVVSPSTGQLDRVKKMPVYAQAGVEWLWLLDPLARTLEIWRRDGERWAHLRNHGGDDVVNAEPFEALALALARLWLPE